jgi:hypothetical protein
MPPPHDTGELVREMIEMIETIDRERLARARTLGAADRLLEGPRLFDRACRVMRDGLRHEFPAATDERLDDLLRDRWALLDRLNGR